MNTSRPFEAIKAQYSRQFQVHGDSPASLLTPKGRHQLRFRAIEPYLKIPGTRVLDYGCGLGFLARHILDIGTDTTYTGFDILPEFVSTCRTKFADAGSRVRFEVIDPTAPLSGDYDVVFASGVFNLQIGETKEASRAYTFARLRELFAATRGVLICDFLSAFVDFQQDGGMHFGVDEIASFCVRDLSRRFQIRHDLLPYEFTLIAHRDGAVKHPESIFAADLAAYIPPA